MSRSRRSNLSPAEARDRYIQLAEMALIEQIQLDAQRLDRDDDGQRVAVGPFARLRADQVAANADGKSRGAITNLFKSQRQFQLSAMALCLDDPSVDETAMPDPGDFDDPGMWIEAIAAAESARGPLHGMEPAVGYALNWVLWLSQVPYGVWSERIADPSMREFRHSAERIENDVIRPGLARFELEIRPPWTPLDLGAALDSLIEGLWLNQCLSREHPMTEGAPIVDAARKAVRMLWEGATRPAATRT
jgi:hypothetical protein